MYYNDCIQIRVKGGLSALWFTKGVKQSCVLSPMLFSLYISGLGKVLHSLCEGIDFDGVVISAIFFADNLVLISRTKKCGLKRMLHVVGRFYEGIQMKLQEISTKSHRQESRVRKGVLTLLQINKSMRSS